jgi:hypothetical protein
VTVSLSDDCLYAYVARLFYSCANDLFAGEQSFDVTAAGKLDSCDSRLGFHAELAISNIYESKSNGLFSAGELRYLLLLRATDCGRTAGATADRRMFALSRTVFDSADESLSCTTPRRDESAQKEIKTGEW